MGLQNEGLDIAGDDTDEENVDREVMGLRCKHSYTSLPIISFAIADFLLHNSFLQL